ncbi:MAG: 4-hydroxythreonine-4-phosphate dehydrogenase PdxA, partial [Opitutales bacterium]|nr:4-hydroxythreonine-4-phosphate dehydrogenase PdxA [Opitutales bacterium]
MTTVDQTLPLAITCGDPAGVGPEVIAGALRMEPSLAKDCVLIGAREWAEPLSAELGMAYESVGAEDFSPSLGVPSLDGAQVALDALKVAAQGCVAGRFRGVVSGPVSKHWLQQVGFKHPGQT